MEHISFVILHYMSYTYTKNCIDSILQNIIYENYSIVVVDNASPNDSSKLLTDHYNANPKVIILSNQSNSGFAKGNNIGYAYAKNQLHSSYVVVANNDTLFEQTDFIEEVIALFNKHNYYILGPDIITLAGTHQNPYRSNVIDHKAAKKWLRNRQLWTWYLYLDKYFKISTVFSFVNSLFMKRREKNNLSNHSKMLQTNIVLQGACIIFSPLYVNQQNHAFYPNTYMYCEEDILAYQCAKENWKILYSPSISIVHAECGSTKELHSNTIDKDLFQSQNIVKSLKILLKLMKE
ncbi:MAG: glycosyltransferase [Lachnotalea sp.]